MPAAWTIASGLSRRARRYRTHRRGRYVVSAMRVILGLLLGAAFLGAMIYATLGESQVECEVCLEFGGRSACRTGSAVDRKNSIRGAVATACAVLSSGVTDGIACGSTPPRSVSCND
jgi:hypothetical protein